MWKYIDANLGTLSGVAIALATLLAHIAGLLPANDAAVVASASIGAGLLGRGLAFLGNASPSQQMAPEDARALTAEMHAGLTRIEALTDTHAALLATATATPGATVIDPSASSGLRVASKAPSAE